MGDFTEGKGGNEQIQLSISCMVLAHKETGFAFHLAASELQLCTTSYGGGRTCSAHSEDDPIHTG